MVVRNGLRLDSPYRLLSWVDMLVDGQSWAGKMVTWNCASGSIETALVPERVTVKVSLSASWFSTVSISMHCGCLLPVRLR